jgi:hypothetical protein
MTRTSSAALCLAFFPFVLCPQVRAQQTGGTPPEPPKDQSTADKPPEPPKDQEKPAAPATPASKEAPASEKAPEAPKAPPPKGLLFNVGQSTLKFGGYVKVDLIHDFDRIGSTDSFDPRTIDTSDLPGENTRMHARETRLNMDLRTPTDMGELKTYIEGDFFGDGNSFRLRHAYGQLGPVLAGQTWSTFMDEDAMPSTLDFESPIEFPLSRQAQVRYTQTYENGNSASISLEDPNNDLVSPPGVPGVVESSIPDVDARVRLNNDRGHVQLGLFGGLTKFRPDAGASDSVSLWGVNLSAKERTWGTDFAIVQLTYGDGVGRFRGGVTAAPDSNGNLEAVRTSAWMASYQHNWSDKYRSTVVYSAGRGDLPGGAPPDANEELTYFAANLIWQFCNRAWVGIEYLHGTRDTFDGSDGAADRLQMSMRFDL